MNLINFYKKKTVAINADVYDNRYRIGSQLGEGQFGKVFSMNNIQDTTQK
jgi:hypothetical protein